MNEDLIKYLNDNILPIYNNNDLGHGIDHINYVIKRSLRFAKDLNLDLNMVYTIAIYHDCGHSIDPSNHEVISSNILFNDINLKSFFSEDKLIIMKEAVEDHRAQLNKEPRSIYGKIISSADRSTSVNSTLKRTYEYDKKNFPNFSTEELINECKNHIISKFGKNGYAINKMYFKDIEYEKFLEDINNLVNNNENFIKTFKIVNNI